MDIIDEVIEREGPPTDDPDDPGGRTKFGISEHSHPDAWADGDVSSAEAHAIYRLEYIEKPRFDRVEPIALREQLIDFGVTSGPRRPILFLQHILGVDRDGVIGPGTLAALAARDPREVNNLLVGLREQFYRDVVRARPSSQKFLKGWIRRARKFLLP